MLTEPTQTLWKQVRAATLPLVVIDTDISDPDVDRVLVDNTTGTRDAVRHLLVSVMPELCFFIGGPKNNYDTQQRAKVFRASLAERMPGLAGLDEHHLHFGEYSVEWGHTRGLEILSKHRANPSVQEPIGILAANDEIAFGVMLAAADLGLTIPGDVRIIGFDDTRLASLLRPGLSTVRVPMAQVGAAAISALVDRIDEPDREATCTRLPTELIIRGTSAPNRH